jgi:hypothetical protein
MIPPQSVAYFGTPSDRHVFQRGPELLDAVKVDARKIKVQVDLSPCMLYAVCGMLPLDLTGKRIRRIVIRHWPDGGEEAAE